MCPEINGAGGAAGMLILKVWCDSDHTWPALIEAKLNEAKMSFSIPSAGTACSAGAERMCYNSWVGILDPKADAKTGERFKMEFIGLLRRNCHRWCLRLRRLAQEGIEVPEGRGCGGGTGEWDTGESTEFCCVSIQGLHPSKDPAFAVFEGESFRETSLTASAVVKCDGLDFGAFPGCVTRCFTLTSRFLSPRPAKVTIYATRCHHFLSSFFFFRRTKNLGICEATKDSSGVSSKKREKRSLRFGTAFAWRCDVRMQHLKWDSVFVLWQRCRRLDGKSQNESEVFRHEDHGDDWKQSGSEWRKDEKSILPGADDKMCCRCVRGRSCSHPRNPRPASAKTPLSSQKPRHKAQKENTTQSP